LKKINKEYFQQDIKSAINLFSTGRTNEALLKLENLKKDYSDEPLLYNIIGVCLKSIGKLNDAIKNFDIALKLKPDFFEVNYNLGLTQHQLGNTLSAVENYKIVLKHKPDHAEVHANLGNALQALGQVQNAISSYEKAIEIKPTMAEAHNNLGNILREYGQLNKASESYEKALNLKPNFAEVYNNLGIVQMELGNYNAALELYKRALSINKSFAEVHANLGKTLKRLKREDEALVSYENAFKINSNINYILGDLLYSRMSLCVWSNYTELISEVEKKINNNKNVIKPFPTLSLINNPLIQKKAAQIFCKAIYPIDTNFPELECNPRANKIRIGYFSPDFRDHAVASLTCELFEMHNRDQFEIYAFYFGPSTQDEMNLRIQNGVDFFYDVCSMSHKAVSNLSRTLKIDIAVDLCGYTQNCRPKIFARRSAPVQINYLGYPGTMGGSFIDYIIADQIIIPKECQKYYSEKIIYMPNCYQANSSKKTITESSISRYDAGLPKSGFIFCCFNSSYKITPDVFKSWMRILSEVDNSFLWLFDNKGIISKNLKIEAEKLGVDSNRLIFASYKPGIKNFSNRIKHADLFLDSMPYNAHTMASDTLRMGVPVLTCMGETFASRVAASLLEAVQIPELVTNSKESYESVAIKLANNPEKLKNIKIRLAKNLLTSSLYNSKLFVKNLEDAYLKIYEKSQNGKKTDHIYV